MPVDDFNLQLGKRLRKVREALGLSLASVSSRIGFDSYQTLMSIEKGARPIKTWELVKLARVYGRSASDFMAEAEPPTAPVFLWRAPAARQDARLYQENIVRAIDQYNRLEECAQVERATFSPPAVARRIESFNQARMLGSGYAQLLGLGARPGQVLAQVLEESQGVQIIYLDLRQCGSAVSTMTDRGPVICVNRHNAPWRRNFDIAHELFHLVTWNLYRPDEVHPPGGHDPNRRDSGSCPPTKQAGDMTRIAAIRDRVPGQSPDPESCPQTKSLVEKYADTFAAALLIPAEVLRQETTRRAQDRDLTLGDIIGLAREFAVSTDALLIALEQVGVITRRQVEALRQSEPFKQLDREERRCDWDDHPPVSRRFVELGFRCLTAGTVSKARFAELMDIGLGEVGRFLRTFGFELNLGLAGEIPAV